MLKTLRHFSHSRPLEIIKVCILGADGNIGRPLAINLKLNNYVTELALFDAKKLAGVREDLSHINTKACVTAFSGNEKALVSCLRHSDMVVIVAGQAHSPKFSSREAMFSANAELMIKFMKATACACYENMPFIFIVTNPVNSLVPLCAEYLKRIGCYNPRKICGCSSVDTMRARTFLGQLVGYDPSKLVVPVVGGHSSGSITPIISQSKPTFNLNLQESKKLANRIIHGAAEVFQAKNRHGAACLALGHCVARFCDSVFRAINGEPNIVEVGYVPANVNELEFFACYFSLDSQGINECYKLPPMLPYESELYSKAVEDVQNNIEQAKDFVMKYEFKRVKMEFKQ